MNHRREKCPVDDRDRHGNRVTLETKKNARVNGANQTEGERTADQNYAMRTS